jgi:outer membrane lipoprotein-sorting protein
MDAFMRSVPRGGTVVEGVLEAVPDKPSDESENAWRLWIEQPDNVRVEFVVGLETVIAVFRGTTWWSVSPSLGARTNEGNPRSGHGTGPGYPLTDPGRLALALELTLGASTTVAGREALRAMGTPIPPDRLDVFEEEHDVALSDIGMGSTEYELAVDIERGIVLRSEARLDGQPFRIIEMVEVAFDETLPAGTFSLSPPSGEAFKALGPFG